MSHGEFVCVDESHSATGVYIVRLNRPGKLNAIDLETLAELDYVFSVYLVSRLESVKVVILTGEGRGFTSGLDLTSPSVSAIFNPTDTTPGVRAIQLKSLIQRMQQPILAIANFPRPVICAINGLCVGLGMDLACACDIRICSRTCKLSVREIKIGICADLGSLFFLPRICRNDSWVREICFSGRFFDSTEALSQGFVSKVSEGDVVELGLAMAEAIADNPSVAVEGIKVNLDKSSRSNMLENFEFVAVWNSIKLQDSDMVQKCVMRLMSKAKL